MTIQATRAVLLSKLLRAGDRRRIARLLDRLSPADLGRLLAGLSEFELRRAARVLLDEERCARTVANLEPRVVTALVLTAPDDCALRALEATTPRRASHAFAAMSERRRARLLEELPPATYHRVVPLLPRPMRPRHAGEDGLGAVLRLRRLFA